MKNIHSKKTLIQRGRIVGPLGLVFSRFPPGIELKNGGIRDWKYIIYHRFFDATLDGDKLREDDSPEKARVERSTKIFVEPFRRSAVK